MAETEKNVNNEAEVDNQQIPNVHQTHKSPEHKRGFWEGVLNFAKMFFVTPFALIARIAQRLALGKEGAQKADEAAEKEHDKYQEMKADKKIAHSMEEDANSILAGLNKDPAYRKNPLNIKDIEIYVPDTGRQDLRFAINVTLQNDTTYNTQSAKDYSMYINGNGQLVANKMVPPEVIKQVQSILENIRLDVRDGQPPKGEDPTEDTPKGTPSDTKNEDQNQKDQDQSDVAPPADNTQKPKIETPLLQTTQQDGVGVIIDGTYKGQSITMTASYNNPLQATLVYNNESYTCTYDGQAKAISITGADISKLRSEEVRILIAQASHRAFDDIIKADWTHGESGNCLTNGGFVCTTLANQIHDTLQTPGSEKSNALYIVPDLAAGDMVIDVQYAAACKNGQPTGRFNAYPHLYVVKTEQDGSVSMRQADNDEKGKSPSNLKFSANNSTVALSTIEMARRLASAYAETARLPEMQVLNAGHVLFVAHESSKGPSIAVFSGYCGYDKNEIATETLQNLYQYRGKEGALDTFSRAFVSVCESNPQMHCYGMHDNIMYHVYHDENGIPFVSGQDFETGHMVTVALDKFDGDNKVAAAVEAIHNEINTHEHNNNEINDEMFGEYDVVEP